MTLKYYEILGVNKNSSENDIKKAFRNLALTLHPDKGGCPEKFKELNSAYETLKNPQTKNRYDQINNHEAYISQSNQNNQGNMNDIFSQMFGQHFNSQNQNKCADQMCEIQISLEEVYNGCQKNINITLNHTCFECKVNCSSCNGVGFIHNIIQNGPFMIKQQVMCNNCKGIGSVSKKSTYCSKCSGKGEYTENKNIEINIPINVENGHKIKLDNCGQQKQKNNDKCGDLYIIIKVQAHNIFERQNNNLIYKSNLSWKESIVGKKIDIPLFDMNFVLETHTLGVIQGDKPYSIKGKGLKDGDLICIFTVEYPILNEELRKKFENIL
jgi:DnaJ-class molecular chaperone